MCNRARTRRGVVLGSLTVLAAVAVSVALAAGGPPPPPQAVNGHAVGGGLEIALACDLIVAAEDAQFGLTEPRSGLAPETVGLDRLSRQLPPKIAAELIMTAELVSSGFLAGHGLVNKLVPRGEALSTAREWAAKIAANNPSVIEMGKRVLIVTA